MDIKREIKYYLGLADEYDIPTGYDCYVWTGAFCVNGIDWCVRNGKKYEVLQDDMTTEDIHNIYLYLDKVKNKTIRYLKSILNEYHRTDYSEFKWRILLNFWLAYFLPSLYDKYLKLEKIKNENRKFHVNLYKPDCTGAALDQMDFGDILHDDFGFHKYEYSLLLKYMPDITNIIVDHRGNYERMPFAVSDYGELPKHVKSFIDEYRKYKENTNEQDEIVIQSPYIKFTLYKEIMERKYGKISGYFLDYTSQIRQSMNPNRDLDVEWRTLRQNDRDEEKDEFVSLVYKIIGNFIPIAYVEEFDYLKNMALNNYKWGLKPKVLLYDCEGTAINELFKIYMMNIDIEHVLKVDLMHALSYGLGGYSWYQLTEFQMCDECLVCGETKDNMLPTKFIRMPYINFFRLPNQKNDIGNTIIYTNYSYPQHRGRLSLYEWSWQRYVDGELEFFKMLEQEVISELKFRLHPFHKAQWKNKEKVKELIPELIFDEEPIFFESIRNAKLVISEIMGAAALEAISIGKPTMILYNPKGLFVEVNDNYKDIEDMIRVGIIAETPKKLAALVNRIHGDVKGWWNEPERQKVVRKIRDKYMYFPENAKEIWINKVVSYLNER